MEEVWTVVQCYGTHSMLMEEVLGKLDECEVRMSELLISSATDESDTNCPIRMTHRESNDELVYLTRARKGTMRSTVVIEKINDMKMKLGSEFMLRKSGKAKVDSEPPAITANSATENEYKMPLIWGKAMTDCQARRK